MQESMSLQPMRQFLRLLLFYRPGLRLTNPCWQCQIKTRSLLTFACLKGLRLSRQTTTQV